MSRPPDAGVVYLRGSPSWILPRQLKAAPRRTLFTPDRRNPLGLGQSPEIANKNQTEIRAFLPTHTHPRPTHIPALHLSRLYKQTNHATLSCVGSWRFFLPVCDSGHATALFVNSRRITPTRLSLTKPARLVRTDPFSFRTEEATRPPSLLNHQQSNLCALPLSFSLSSSFLSLPSDFPRSVAPRSSSGPRSLVPLCPFSPCSIQIPLGYGDQLRLTCN